MKKFKILLACLLLPSLLWGQEKFWQVNETLPAFKLQDQFDQTGQLDQTVRLVIFARGMESKDLIDELLSGEDGDFLSQHQALYIADISGMPSLITKLFALPKMRGFNYPMLLDYTGKATARIPSREKKVTLVHIEKNKVINIQFLDDVKLLRAEIIREGLP